jgi:uncharacterized protein
VSPGIELTDMQFAALRSVLARFADKIETVGVYGSRARGLAHPGSDVDLVVYGAVDRKDVARIKMELGESDLSIFADIIGYQDIAHPPLNAEIDKWMKPLFRRADLLR